MRLVFDMQGEVEISMNHRGVICELAFIRDDDFQFFSMEGSLERLHAVFHVALEQLHEFGKTGENPEPTYLGENDNDENPDELEVDDEVELEPAPPFLVATATGFDTREEAEEFATVSRAWLSKKTGKMISNDSYPRVSVVDTSTLEMTEFADLEDPSGKAN